MHCANILCEGSDGAGERDGEPGGVWRSTLAYQILLAARQIVARRRRQITQGGVRGGSHPQNAVAFASLAQGTRAYDLSPLSISKHNFFYSFCFSWPKSSNKALHEQPLAGPMYTLYLARKARKTTGKVQTHAKLSSTFGPRGSPPLRARPHLSIANPLPVLYRTGRVRQLKRGLASLGACTNPIKTF